MSLNFAADRTLGKLAKWLRMMGFDTTFDAEASAELFRDQVESDRIVLTRTGAIQQRLGDRRLVFITSNDPGSQLKQVITEIEISPSDTQPFSRCINCNVPIVEVDPDDVYGLVPDYIYENHSVFHKCLQCKRIFWSGSHIKRALEIIENLFK